MRKIMLVIDDFTELEAFESLLKRMGFDVLSLSREVLVGSALHRFHPDLLIATYKGRSVEGVRLAVRLKSMKGLSVMPRVALLYPAGQAPQQTPEFKAVVDALIELPLQPASVIRAMASLLNLPLEPLQAKFEKLDSARATANAMAVPEGHRIIHSREADGSQTGESDGWDPVKTPGQAALVRSQRSDRYDKFLSEHDDGPVDGVIPKAKLLEAMTKLGVDSQGESEELDQIDEAKRAFARALFKPEDDDAS